MAANLILMVFSYQFGLWQTLIFHILASLNRGRSVKFLVLAGSSPQLFFPLTPSPFSKHIQYYHLSDTTYNWTGTWTMPQFHASPGVFDYKNCPLADHGGTTLSPPFSIDLQQIFWVTWQIDQTWEYLLVVSLWVHFVFGVWCRHKTDLMWQFSVLGLMWLSKSKNGSLD